MPCSAHVRIPIARRAAACLMMLASLIAAGNGLLHAWAHEQVEHHAPSSGPVAVHVHADHAPELHRVSPFPAGTSGFALLVTERVARVPMAAAQSGVPVTPAPPEPASRAPPPTPPSRAPPLA